MKLVPDPKPEHKYSGEEPFEIQRTLIEMNQFSKEYKIGAVTHFGDPYDTQTKQVLNALQRFRESLEGEDDEDNSDN